MRTCLLVLLLTLGACKKAVPVEAPVPQLGPSVDSGVQVALITPGEVPAQQATPAQVIGTGYLPGAEVQIGETWLSGVQVVNENTLSITVPAMADGRYDVTVQNADGSSGTLWQALTVGRGAGGVAQVDCQVLTLFFDHDQAALDDHGRALLDAEVGCWMEQGNRVHIEGHADERGTTDYNVALGQRRALSVRKHLSRAGLALHMMTTVSFGEERPANLAHDETAWAENRRVRVEGH